MSLDNHIVDQCGNIPGIPTACMPVVSAECYYRLCSLFAKVSYYNSVVSYYITRFLLQNHPNTEIILPTEALSVRICKAVDNIKSGVILRAHNSQVSV